MDELLGPIIGITLVLMAVFLPAAFLPGLTGQMYRAVRAGHRGDRAHQRRQCGDAEADAMRAVAAPAGAAGEAQLLLSRLQQGLRPGEHAYAG